MLIQVVKYKAWVVYLRVKEHNNWIKKLSTSSFTQNRFIARQLRHEKCRNMHFLLDIFHWWFCIHMINKNDFFLGDQTFNLPGIKKTILAQKGSIEPENISFYLVFYKMYAYKTIGSNIFGPKRAKNMQKTKVYIFRTVHRWVMELFSFFGFLYRLFMHNRFNPANGDFYL